MSKRQKGIARTCSLGRGSSERNNEKPRTYRTGLRCNTVNSCCGVSTSCFLSKKFSLPAPSCATAILAVLGHGQDGRGTSRVAAPPRCATLAGPPGYCSKFGHQHTWLTRLWVASILGLVCLGCVSEQIIRQPRYFTDRICCHKRIMGGRQFPKKQILSRPVPRRFTLPYSAPIGTLISVH